MKKMIEILYAALGILPDRISMKIKLILNICRHDWRFFPVNTFFPFSSQFSGNYEAELKKAEKLIDEKSLARIRKFIEKCRFDHDFCTSLDEYRNCFFIDYSKIGYYFILPMDHDRRLIQARKKYKFRNGGLESLVFLQGISYLNAEQHQYFHDKIGIDAGSYVGHYAIPLLKNDLVSEVWAFEPDEKSRKRFQKNMKKNHIAPARYRLFPYGLSNKDKIINYDPSGIDLRKSGDETCHIVPLDQIATQHDGLNRIGLIKADVEGMGLLLLQGSLKVIQQSRPVLALSAYHCPDELFGQLFYLAENVQNYRYYYVDLPIGSNYEMTLLAIPAELGALDNEEI